MNREHFFSLCRIIEGGISLDPAKVVSYTEQFATQLESDGEVELARRVRQLIAKGGGRKMALAKASAAAPQNPRLPVDGESRQTVADEEFHVRGSVVSILPKEPQQVVTKFLRYVGEADRLIESGVGISPTMLIYGPPGTGKTQLARYIASELKLPLIVSRADGLISSYLGSTAKNVRNLFEHAASRPCVLFLDEFDAIAKMRDDQRELGELKRVVIGLLQNIDAIGRDHVLLAATNHEHLLDPAIWRRFTYKVKLDKPDLNARHQLFGHFLGRFATDELVDLAALAGDGLSGAQIRDICENCVRDAVLDDHAAIAPVHIIQAIAAAIEGREAAEFTLDDAILLVGTNHPKAYTQARLGEIFGKDQSYISRLLRKRKRRA